MPRSWQVWVRAAVITVLVAWCLALVFWLLPLTIWDGARQAQCNEYCEHYTSCVPPDQSQVPTPRDRKIWQPLNAWSNLAYLYAGLVVMLGGAPLGGWVFGVSSCLLEPPRVLRRLG